uniref:BAALC binder of MAP3K1 and KLF4 b n=1 Tax=Lates calcarifer TaxID=8187 RepID=A0A4W6DVG8_LATCA
MGCGGSRADAIIEPRYHESWTRETESTWLTNTDAPSVGSRPSPPTAPTTRGDPDAP